MCSNRLWRLWDCRQAAEEGPPPRRCRKVSLLGAAAAFAGLLGLAAVSPAAEAPPMRVGSEIAYPPFCSLDAQGRADGFSVELIRESLRAMNREATFRVGEWNEVRGWLERGEVEALPLVGRTPEREALYDFTFPYMTLFGAIVVRNGTSGIAGLDDLRGRGVAVMKGDNAEEFLRREDRGIDIRTTPTFEQALRELAEGRHEAVVIQRLVALRLLGELGLKDLRLLPGPIASFRQDFCFAVRKGDADALALLNEGLALAMADGTYRRLHAKWFAALELPSGRRLVFGGDRNYPPYEYLNEAGEPEGFAVALSRAIARETGLDAEIRLGNWDEAVRALGAGEIDALQGMFYSAERSRRFDFTVPHAYQHYVSVVRTGEGAPPESLPELAGRSLVVQMGDLIGDKLGEAGFSNRVMQVETQEDVLEAVAEGRADCGLVMRLSAARILERRPMRVRLGRTPVHSAEYCMAVRKGNAALLTQLNEGLRLLQESGEYRRLQEKWLGVLYEQPPLWRLFARHAAWIGGAVLLAFSVVLLWIRMLRRVVAARTRELRERETFFKAVLDNLPVGVAVNTLDADSRFTYMNDLFPVFYRTTREAIPSIETFWNEVYPDPDVRRRIRERVEADCASGDLDRMQWREIPLGRPGEDTTFISARNRPIPDSREMVSLVWDVTEIKRHEARVEHLTQVLRAIRDVNQLITHEKRLDTLLRRSCEILTSTRGYRSAWIGLQQPSGERPPPRGSARRRIAAESGVGAETVAKLQAKLDAGHPPACWTRALEATSAVVLTDPESRCADCPLSRIYRDTVGLACALRHGDRVYGVLVVALPAEVADVPDERSLFEEVAGDIGYALFAIELEMQRREAEHELARTNEALARSEKTLRAVFESASDGIVVADVENGRFVVANAAFCQMTGCAQEDISNLSVADIHPPEESRNAMTRFKGHATGETALAEAIPVLRRDGSQFLADVASAPLDLGGRRCVVGVFRDISQRLALEDQLRQAQKMEAVGRLAGGVAHDFNNLLMAILGYVDLALDHLAPDHPARADLEEVTRSAQRSADLTRQLLAFARKQTVAPKLLDLSDTVASMLKLLRRLLGEDIDLVWMPCRHPTPVLVDPAQIDQVLANLCVNARDAIHGVGKLVIETDVDEIDAAYCARHAEAVPGMYVKLIVSDSGDGMSAETLRHIFEPFFTTKGLGRGTGLGLATVYGIVKQNGGFINVYSEVGHGTAFKIFLPLAKGRDAAAAGESPAAAADPVGGTETILLVEDEGAIRNSTERYLGAMGYAVLACATPEEALRRAAAHEGPIPLMVTDVVMPGMNGRELANRMSELRPGIQTLFMSGYTANVIVHQGVLDPDANFLQKPVGMAALCAKIRAMLDSSR